MYSIAFWDGIRGHPQQPLHRALRTRSETGVCYVADSGYHLLNAVILASKLLCQAPFASREQVIVNVPAIHRRIPAELCAVAWRNDSAHRQSASAIPAELFARSGPPISAYSKTDDSSGILGRRDIILVGIVGSFPNCHHTGRLPCNGWNQPRSCFGLNQRTIDAFPGQADVLIIHIPDEPQSIEPNGAPASYPMSTPNPVGAGCRGSRRCQRVTWAIKSRARRARQDAILFSAHAI